MKVLIITTNDARGGAAIVASRLLWQLPLEGVEASMLTMHRLGKSPLTVEYGNTWRGRYYFVAERLEIFLNNGFNRKNLFKVSTAHYGFDLSSHPMVEQADVLIINWINQGGLSLRSIEKLLKLSKPVVWIMHDSWQATGICHHSPDCNRFEHGARCGRCPYLESDNPNDLSHRVHLQKQQLYKAENLHFVAVSHWLAHRCAESTLLADADVRVIPNAFPIGNFSCMRLNTISSIPLHKCVVVMGAARLDDPIKGFPVLIETMKVISNQYPDEASRLHLLLFGDLRDKNLLQQLTIPYTYLGAIANDDVAETYQNGDIVLSTSHFETLPGTLIEGAAAGCIPVTFGNSGQTDIVQHMTTGYIARYMSPESMAEGIVWAMQKPVSRQALYDMIDAKFSAHSIAWQYKELFDSLI